MFVDRASINLHSDILDHPEFFWEDDEWLSLYLRAAKYLEIDRRAEVLNKRLDIIKELFDMLASELHNSHSNKYVPLAFGFALNLRWRRALAMS